MLPSPYLPSTPACCHEKITFAPGDHHNHHNQITTTTSPQPHHHHHEQQHEHRATRRCCCRGRSSSSGGGGALCTGDVTPSSPRHNGAPSGRGEMQEAAVKI
ncbi:unnamed protein product [Lampetra planeri]